MAKAAGPKLQGHSTHIIYETFKNKLEIGDAVVTPAYDLAEDNLTSIIHAVGPDCRDPKQRQRWTKLLAKTYDNIFKVAQKNGFESIALTSISTGIFDCPLEEAVEVALDAIEKHTLGAVYIIANDMKTVNAYKMAIENRNKKSSHLSLNE